MQVTPSVRDETSGAPVDAPFQRYADEFIHRVYGMTLPAVAVLAAFAFARGWRSTLGWQLGAFVVALAAEEEAARVQGRRTAHGEGRKGVLHGVEAGGRELGHGY